MYSQQGTNDVDAFDVQGAFKRFKGIILKRKLLILSCCILSLILVWTYKSLFPPIYRAEVLVQAEPQEDKAREHFYSAWNTFRKSELSSEKELMTSTPVVREVVTELDLTYDDVYHTHLKHAIYLWEKSTIGKFYRKVKHWIFPPPESPFDLTEEEKMFAKTVNGFKDGAVLEPVPDSHIGYLVVKGPSFRVAEYANSLIDAYADFRRQYAAEEAETAYQALLKEVARAEKERDIIMQKKLAFENQSGLAMGFSKDKAVMENAATLDQGIQALEFKMGNLTAGLKVIQQQLKNESPFILKSNEDGRNPLRDQMRDSLFALEKDLDASLLVYQENSPEIRNLKKRIEELEASIPDEPAMVGAASGREISFHYEELRARSQEIQAELASAAAELERMNETKARVDKRLNEIPNLEKQYLVHVRDQEIALVKLRTLREKLVQADVSRITAESAPPSLRVVDYASPPEKNYWPNTKLLLAVALLLGFSGGCGLAVLIEVLDNRATQLNLQGRTDMPIYATVAISHRSNSLQRLIYKQVPKEKNTGKSDFAIDRLKGNVS